MTVADRIRQRREELKLTQDEVASKLGLGSKASISQIEKSGDDVSMKNVIRLATALNTTPRFLMGFDDKPQEETQFTTLNQVYRVLKNDKQFDDRAIPVVFGYADEEDMLYHIRNYGPIIIPYSRVREVASIYNLSPAYLMGFTHERKPIENSIDTIEEELKKVATVDNPNIEEELELIKNYRKASSETKNIVKRILIPV